MPSPSFLPDAEAVGDSAPASLTALAKSWHDLRPGNGVELRHPTLPTISGTVDTMTEDRSIVWVFSVPHGRIMIHADDGYCLSDAN